MWCNTKTSLTSLSFQSTDWSQVPLLPLEKGANRRIKRNERVKEVAASDTERYSRMALFYPLPGVVFAVGTRPTSISLPWSPYRIWSHSCFKTTLPAPHWDLSVVVFCFYFQIWMKSSVCFTVQQLLALASHVQWGPLPISFSSSLSLCNPSVPPGSVWASSMHSGGARSSVLLSTRAWRWSQPGTCRHRAACTRSAG